MRKHQQQQKLNNVFVDECLKTHPSIRFIDDLLQRGANPNAVFSLNRLNKTKYECLLTNLSISNPDGIDLFELLLMKGLVIKKSDRVALRVFHTKKLRRCIVSPSGRKSVTAWLDELIALNAKYPDGISMGFLSRLALKLDINGPGTSNLEKIISAGGDFSSILWEDLGGAKIEHLDKIISFSSGQEVGKQFVFNQPGIPWKKINEIIRTICEISAGRFNHYSQCLCYAMYTIPFLTNLRAFQPNMILDTESAYYFVSACLVASHKYRWKIARSARVELIGWILESLKRHDNGSSLSLVKLLEKAPSKKRKYDLYRAWSGSDLVGSWALEDEIEIVVGINYLHWNRHEYSAMKPYEPTEEERLIQTFNNPLDPDHYTTVFYAPHHYLFLVPFQKRIIRTVLLIRSFGSSILTLVPNEILFEIFSYLAMNISMHASMSVSIKRHQMYDSNLALWRALSNVRYN